MGHMTERTLHRKMKQNIGLSPKTYLSVLRFKKVVDRIQSGPLNWQDILFDCGYFDQAHFSKDFKKYAGLSPEKYVQVNSLSKIFI
jgi:transcriptional regulator GlxA family with amidase domain